MRKYFDNEWVRVYNVSERKCSIPLVIHTDPLFSIYLVSHILTLICIITAINFQRAGSFRKGKALLFLYYSFLDVYYLK